MTNALPAPEPVFVSATQIDTWRRCRRKWAWDKLDRIPRAQNRFAELGSRVHKVLEGWLRDGVPPDANTEEGRIAMAGIQHLPVPKTGLVESQFTFGFDGEDFLFTGFIDWQNDDTVLDHKTTGDLKWAKTPEDLAVDVQGTVYAAAKFVHNADLDEVLLRWIYYRTKRAPKSLPVELRVPRSVCEKRMLPIVNDARDIAKARRTGGTALDFEPNVNECDAFGGCAYVKHCQLTSVQRMKALMAQSSLAEKLENNEMGLSLADKLKAKKNAQTINAPEGPTEEEEEQAAAPAPAPATKTKTTKVAAKTKPAKTAAPASEATLRDHYAMSAMSAIVSARLLGLNSLDDIASNSYELADAMLAERNKP